jgi:fluoroacetyl-CoA thioesterase
MKHVFKVGDQKQYRHKVTKDDFASFHGKVVHPVCSTFALARDVEWTTRQFVLEMRDADEEGIGTFVHVDHKSPAFEGDEIQFTGVVDSINSNEIVCTVEANVHGRLIAVAKTGQKIFKKDKIEKLFQRS